MERGLKIRNLGPQKFNNFRKLTFVWLMIFSRLVLQNYRIARTFSASRWGRKGGAKPVLAVSELGPRVAQGAQVAEVATY